MCIRDSSRNPLYYYYYTVNDASLLSSVRLVNLLESSSEYCGNPHSHWKLRYIHLLLSSPYQCKEKEVLSNFSTKNLHSWSTAPTESVSITRRLVSDHEHHTTLLAARFHHRKWVMYAIITCKETHICRCIDEISFCFTTFVVNCRSVVCKLLHYGSGGHVLDVLSVLFYLHICLLLSCHFYFGWKNRNKICSNILAKCMISCYHYSAKDFF